MNASRKGAKAQREDEDGWPAEMLTKFVPPSRWKRMLAVGPLQFFNALCGPIPARWLNADGWRLRVAVWVWANAYWLYERVEGRV